jgi:hypothetical protein
MNIEKYWDKYINEDLVSIYPETKELFSNELPKDFLDNYNYEEVILETTGKLENAKEFDKSVEFIDILQSKQPEIFKEIYHYLDDFLVEYYCFNKDWKKLTVPINDFIKEPVQGIDNLLSSFSILENYQCLDECEKLIKKTYSIINNSDELMSGSGYSLALTKLFIEIEKSYENYQICGKFNRKKILQKTEKFDLDPDIDLLNSFETAFTNENLTFDIIDDVCGNKLKNSNYLFKSFFLKRMYERGISFVLSSKIWNNCSLFWYDDDSEENNEEFKTTQALFDITKDSFTCFLRGNGALFYSYQADECALILWGIQYIYEFLYNNSLIDENLLIKATDIINREKALFIKKNLSDLWKYSFVHHWLNDEFTESDNYIAEKNLFEKSYTLKHVSFRENSLIMYEDEIRGCIDGMLSLKPYLTELTKEIPKKPLFSGYNNAYSKNESDIPQQRIGSGKISRNASCPCGSGKKYKKCCGK